MKELQVSGCSEVAPGGKIRAVLNLNNFLLNSDRSKEGEWLGVAPDLARALHIRSAST